MAAVLEKLIWQPEALTAKLEAAGPVAMKAATEIIRTSAPKRTGTMAKGIRLKVISPTVGTVYIPKPGYFVIKGTAPHDINPRKGSVLAFEWNGEQVFFASVHHPGTSANPFHEAGVAAFPQLYAKTARAAASGVGSAIAGAFGL